MIAEGLLENAWKISPSRAAPFSPAASATASRRLSSDRFLGRLFETPDAVFPEEMLRPEKQSLALFAAGVDAIVDAQRARRAELF